MLTPYFAFGVPVLLIFIYILFLWFYKKTQRHYLRLILLLISTFLLAFSFQVMQESWKIAPETLTQAPYNKNWLWLPLGGGLLLTLINLGRVIHQFSAYSQLKK